MSRIAGMASGDKQRYSCSQPTPEAEAPSSIFTAIPAKLPEGPALRGPSEAGPSPSEADLSDIIIFLI